MTELDREILGIEGGIRHFQEELKDFPEGKEEIEYLQKKLKSLQEKREERIAREEREEEA